MTNTAPVTAIDWTGGSGPIAVYEPPHPLAFTADECDAFIADPFDEWANESPGVARVGREIGDPVLRDRIVEPLVAANTLRWRHDIGVGSETRRQLLRYTIGGKMLAHADRMDLRNHEDIATSLVAQLSDSGDYQGGDVEFCVHDQVIRLPRVRGTVAVFDSTVPHRVLGVTGGTRYSVTVFGRPSPLPPPGDEMIGYEPPVAADESEIRVALETQVSNGPPRRSALLTVCPVIVPPRDGLLDSWDHPNHMLVINGDVDDWRQRCQDRGWSYLFDRYSRNLTCPAAWNLAFHRAKRVGATHVTILSQGLVLAGGTSELARIVAKRPSASWIEVSGGVRQAFHCIVFSVDLWEQVGGFDETLPIWCDVDFFRRIWLSGRWDRLSARAVRVQLPADDLRNTAVRGGVVPAHVYDVDRQRYVDKWGGPHHAETFTRPWDASSVSPDAATPTRVLAHGGFAALIGAARLTTLAGIG